MARGSSRASVVLLDVAEPMHGFLDAAAASISANMAAKAVNSPKDQVSLVLYGTTGAKNSVHQEVGDSQQYLRIEEVWPMRCPYKAEFSALENLPRGRGKRPAEVLEALVVAIDVLKKSVTAGNKGAPSAEIVLASNFLGETVPSDAGLIDAVVDQLQKIGASLRVIFLKMETDWNLPQAITRVIDMLGSKGTIKTIKTSGELLADTFKTKDVAPTTTYRGPLTISSALEYPVWVYKKTSKITPPTLKLYSEKIAGHDPSATHEIRADREYKSKNDPEKTLLPEELVKGLPYGSQMVPMDAISEHLKFTVSEKGFRVLRFVPEGNIPRGYFMDETSVVLPEPNNACASKAMSACVHAMVKTGKVAIARAVWRANSTRIIVGALTPYMGTSTRADGMIFNELPFAEDYRPFQFASFENMKVKPNQEQVQAMKDIIRRMNVDVSNEQFRPEMTGNPRIAAFYLALAAAMGHTSARRQLEALDTRLAKRPCKMMCADDVCAAKGRVLASYLKNATPVSGDAGTMGMAATPELQAGVRSTATPESAECSGAATIVAMGTATSVQDFVNMMAHPAQQKGAISQAKKIVIELVQDSIGDRFLPKALELLTTLRQQCVQLGVDHANEFNDYFLSLKSLFQTNPAYNAFWTLVVDSNTSLVTDAEVPGCTTTPDDAKRALLAHPQLDNYAAVLQQQEAPGAGAVVLGVVDDEFDDME